MRRPAEGDEEVRARSPVLAMVVCVMPWAPQHDEMIQRR